MNILEYNRMSDKEIQKLKYRCGYCGFIFDLEYMGKNPQEFSGFGHKCEGSEKEKEKNVKKEIVKNKKIKKKYPALKKHICRFNDRDCICECFDKGYKARSREIIKNLKKMLPRMLP